MDMNETLVELEALIKYLVNHNESHTKELEELALSLKAAGKLEAYASVSSAIENYKKGNASLAASLEQIKR